MDRFDEAVQCLRELIRFDSVQGAPAEGAPFGKGVGEALEYMLGVMKAHGFRTFNGDGYYGYAEIGDKEKPLFGVLNHLDVVPVTEGWSHAPFGGEIADGYIWGRGTEDDKGPAVAAFFAAAELLDEGRAPKVRLRFILGTNEESGWKCMEAYKAREEMPSEGFSPDADFPVINCEKGVSFYSIKFPLPEGVYSLKAGTRANIVPDSAEAVAEYSEALINAANGAGAAIERNGKTLKITTSGKSAHGSSPEKGVNALIALLKILKSVSAVAEKLHAVFAPTNGAGAGMACRDEQSGALTLNAGAARTEGSALYIETDIRYPVTVNGDAITEKLKAALPEAEITLKNHHDPLYVPKDSPLVKGLLEAYKKVTGDSEAEAISIGGATYARVLPCGVAFGPIFPGEESYIHMRDERISLASFKKMIKIYKEAFAILCFE